MNTADKFKAIFSHDQQAVVGVDEAGRGAMAGPVVVAAVMLPTDISEGLASSLNDSKAISPKERERVHDLIVEEATSISIVMAEPESIDEFNVLYATMRCMTEAAEEASAWITNGEPVNVLAVFDGDTDPYQYTNFKKPEYITPITVVKADAMIPTVMAAGIMAKVTRDRLMASHASDKFSFDQHFGYVTEKHKEELMEHGPIKGLHRFSYAPVKWAEITMAVKKEENAHRNS